MTKFIISAGFGGEWQGTFENRFDPELIRIMEEERNLISGARGNPEKRKALHTQLKDRLLQLNITCDASDLAVIQLPSGTRFKIEEYDGAEYVITEHDLDCIVP
jgi:hypothetical protein